MTRDLLEELAAFKPLAPPTYIRPPRNGRGEFDLEGWIKKQDIKVRREGEWGQGGHRWVLEECPWNGHADKAAFIVQFPGGAIAAGCHHNSCEGKGWQEFRQHYEPRCYEHGSQEGHVTAKPEIHPSGILLSEVKTEQVSWLWRGWIARGKLSVIDGDPGLGKSAAVLDIVARLSTGRPFPDGSRCESGAGGVIILSAEDGLADTIKPRLDAAGADTSRILSLATISVEGEDGRHERLLSVPEDIPLIEHEIERVGAKLVIVDPLMAFLSGEINSHKDQDVRRALAPLAAMAERTGVAVHVVRHLSKGDGKSPIYRGGGSIGIIGAARMGSLVAKDPQDENRRVMAPTKNNLAIQPKSLLYTLEEADNGAVKVVWSGESELSAGDLLQTSNGAEAEARTEAEYFLSSLLADGPVPAATILEEAKAAGITESTLRRAKKNLGITPKRENNPHGHRGEGRWVWELPKLTMSGQDIRNLQGAQGAGYEHLEQNGHTKSVESGVDKGNLQDVQANGQAALLSSGEHLERAAEEANGRLLLTDEILREINRSGSGAAKQAELYRRGEITETNAVEWIAKAILRHKGANSDSWQASAPAVGDALTHPISCACEWCL